MSEELFYNGVYQSLLLYIEDEKTEIMLSSVTKICYDKYIRYKNIKKKQLIIKAKKLLNDIGTLDSLIDYGLSRSYLMHKWITVIELCHDASSICARARTEVHAHASGITLAMFARDLTEQTYSNYACVFEKRKRDTASVNSKR